MTTPGRRRRGILMRVFLAASAITAVTAMVVAARRVSPDGAAEPPPPAPVVSLSSPDEPIPEEAGVFRTTDAALAIDPATSSRRSAHPRTLETFRGLRAYPGAPPRIPHGLTPTEFQTGDCNTCHERGGYSQRFGAYVPVTPHPEMGACLQCHVGDAVLMAIALPSTDPSARCRQCHAAGGTPRVDAPLDWVPPAWPAVVRTTSGSPPPIPHTLQLRGNCLACHAAPSGVEEIRTRHPERANCRQCHVELAAESSEWVRTTAARAP